MNWVRGTLGIWTSAYGLLNTIVSLPLLRQLMRIAYCVLRISRVLRIAHRMLCIPYVLRITFYVLQPQHPAADQILHDLVGAAIDRVDPYIQVEPGDRIFEHIAVAAMELDALVDHPAGQIGAPPLGHGGFLGR